MVTRVTGHLRLDKRYFKELSFIQVALTGLDDDDELEFNDASTLLGH